MSRFWRESGMSAGTRRVNQKGTHNAMNSVNKKKLFGILAAALLIFFDQLTKYLAVHALKGKASIVIWEGVFELCYLENRGAAFGILQNQKWPLIIFTVLVLAVIVYIYLKKIPTERRFLPLNRIAVLFFSGAVGNFIDRLVQDYVVDFFYFVLIDFPIFNVADIYVTVAAFLLIVLGLFYYREEDFERIMPSKKKKDTAS